MEIPKAYFNITDKDVSWGYEKNSHKFDYIIDYTKEGLLGNFDDNTTSQGPVLLIKELKNNNINTKYGYVMNPVKLSNSSIPTITTKELYEKDWDEHILSLNGTTQVLINNSSTLMGFELVPVELIQNISGYVMHPVKLLNSSIPTITTKELYEKEWDGHILSLNRTKQVLINNSSTSY